MAVQQKVKRSKRQADPLDELGFLETLRLLVDNLHRREKEAK